MFSDVSEECWLIYGRLDRIASQKPLTLTVIALMSHIQ